MRDLVVITFVLACSIVALRRPVFGMLVFVGLGFFNPHSMTWTIGQTFRLSLLVGLTTILGYLFGSEPKKFPGQRESILLLLLWGMFALATLFAIYPERAIDRFVSISKIFLMVLLLASSINTEHRLHLLVRVIALSLGFFGLKGGLFALFTGGQYRLWGPEGSFLYDTNAFGLALVMNIPLLVYLLKRETQFWLRSLIKAMVVFSYPATVITFSRGAWVGLAVVTVLIILKSQRKVLLASLMGIVAMLIVPFLPQLLSERVVARYDTLVNYEQDQSAESRFWSWEFCKRVGLANPLTGAGFDFVETGELYATYYPEFIERWGPGKRWSCHNMWLTVFSETGLLSFMLWLGLIGTCFLSLRQMRSHARTHEQMSWIIDCANMLQVALVAYMVTGTFVDAAYFDIFYYLVAIIVIIKERVRLTLLEAFSPANVTVADQPLLINARSPLAG